jgi:hypothetical protein
MAGKARKKRPAKKRADRHQLQTDGRVTVRPALRQRFPPGQVFVQVVTDHGILFRPVATTSKS